MAKFENCELTLLCRVVDNYGDIGVVFRLAKALSALLPDGGAGLRLIVDNLASFAQLSPGVDVTKPVQEHRSWTVCQWDAAREGRALYTETPPLVIVECFACGRPEWLDDILFDKQLQALRRKPVQIINLEYLTAEPYADEFHKLMSLTRSAQVKKVNFMPGFTDKTGGLILDGVPLLCGSAPAVTSDGNPASDCVPVLCDRAPTVTDGDELCAYTSKPASADENRAQFAEASASSDKPFTVLVFTYEHDFSSTADALAAFSSERKDIRILVAAGKSEEPFRTAWKTCADRAHTNEKRLDTASLTAPEILPEPEKLPFLPQDEWDTLLYSADFLFIRGEDSLSRACLSGKPFVWHAYPQTEMYHLVKVRALLDRMEPFFSAENFRLISDYWLWFNGDETITGNAASGGDTNTACAKKASNRLYDSRAALIKILSRYDELHESFRAFSKSLIKNGNLAEHLMTFITEIV